MITIKENIANNIIALRKSKGWTQLDLANILNYSDKTISKWERCESTPDVEIIYQMAQLFEVPVDYFFKEANSNNDDLVKQTQESIFKRILILSLYILGLYFISICIFIYLKIERSDVIGSWMSFIWPLPFLGLISAIYLYRHKVFNHIPFILSFSLWSTLTAFFLQYLIFGKNIWLIFLAGIPIQAAIIITYWLKK